MCIRDRTSILKRFQDGTFTYSTKATVGIDYVAKEVRVGEVVVPIKIWDTAGQERMHSITHSFYKLSQGVMLVFDVGSKSSFENVHRWMKNIQKHADSAIIKYLLGNKIDTDSREVSKDEAEKIAAQYDMKYRETSARANINITETVASITADIMNTLSVSKNPEGFGLTPKIVISDSRKCCF
eukprot:TRINITY_DN15113_c0_g1_i2.p1 TRINITY_DN15113_c0_g1~~TRINITY_DN15113_c0_g1_i2.p1  ORF type:complete len:183 (+),score=19.95 TRINITY_DN15113_c0_g1_i2:112-660(+)